MEASGTLILYGDRSVAWAIIRDVTGRKRLERELEHRAFHDELTGLPNRALFTEHLAEALARADRSGSLAVLFLDLDNFKFVNDSLSHEAGNRLLVEVAGRLRSCLRRTDSAARLGGDEFTVLVEGVAGAERAVAAAKADLPDATRAFRAGRTRAPGDFQHRDSPERERGRHSRRAIAQRRHRDVPRQGRRSGAV